MQNDTAPELTSTTTTILLLLLLPLLPPLLLLLLLLLLHCHWLFTSLAFTAGPAWVALLWPTVPIAVFFFLLSLGPWYAVPWKSCPERLFEMLGKADKHVVFERCPERCPNDARPDGSSACQEHRALSQSSRTRADHTRQPSTFALPWHIMMLRPLWKEKRKRHRTDSNQGPCGY